MVLILTSVFFRLSSKVSFLWKLLPWFQIRIAIFESMLPGKSFLVYLLAAGCVLDVGVDKVSGGVVLQRKFF